jgi:hypothetical protein
MLSSKKNKTSDINWSIFIQICIHIYMRIVIMCARSAAVLNNPHKLHSSILHQHKSFAARFKTPLWRENCTKIVTRRVSARWNISSRERNKVCNAVTSFWYCDIQQSQNNIYFSCLHFNVNRIKLLTQYHIIHCFIFRYVYWRTPRLVAAWSMECVWGLLPAGIAGSNYVGVWMSVFFLSRVIRCIGLIIRPEESCRVWYVWVWSWSLGKEKAVAD